MQQKDGMQFKADPHFMGIDHYFMFFGVVESRDDPMRLGRCKVRIVGIHPDDKTLVSTDDLPWAYPIMPVLSSAASSASGHTPVGPVEGTHVIGFFADGMDRQIPMFFGTLTGGDGQFKSGDMCNQPSDSTGTTGPTSNTTPTANTPAPSTAKGNTLKKIRPVTGGTITSPFNEKRSYENHPGVDYGVPVGTPVYAAADGTVVIAGSVSGYGNAIYINHPDGTQSRYGHLSQIQVSVSTKVTAGQQIGLSGNTGRSTGPHLHFELRSGQGTSKSNQGSSIDPIQWLGNATTSTDKSAPGGSNVYKPNCVTVGGSNMPVDPNYANAPTNLNGSVTQKGVECAKIFMAIAKKAGGLDHFEDYHVAAIMGNIAIESRFRAVYNGNYRTDCDVPPSVGQRNRPYGGSSAYGFAQWIGDRCDNFIRYCNQYKVDPRTPTANIGFLVQELKTSYSQIIRAVNRGGMQTAADSHMRGPWNVNDPDGKGFTAYWCGEFERPGADGPKSLAQRCGYTAAILAGLRNTQVPPRSTGH